MIFKQLIELYDLLDSPSASGAGVVEYLRGIDPACDAETYVLEGPKGSTDMVRVRIPGSRGRAAGGEAVAAQIGEIMGVSAGAAVKQIAQVHCTGCGQNYKQYTYVGIHDCVAASKLPGGGDLGCAYGCLGLGSCEKACPFDAIHVIDGVARVDEEKCKACNKCVDICPRHIIALEPYKTKRHVTIPCSSHDKGVDARKVCDNGCIGCSLCAKSCPKEAITMVNNLAVIDYEKCIGCGICAQKCPRKLITVDGKVPEVKPAAPKAAPDAAVKPAAPATEKPTAEAAADPKAEVPAEPKE